MSSPFDKRAYNLGLKAVPNFGKLTSDVISYYEQHLDEIPAALMRGFVIQPFAFERNEHGHIVITFVGLDLTGAQEVERLEAAGYNVGGYAKSCFTSTMADSYEANHRLVAGKVYHLALMPGKEILKDSERTTANLRKLGMEKYGYGKPLGGHIPRTRETVSDKQMEEMGAMYIASLHDSIADSGGGPSVLGADRDGGGRRVDACWGSPGGQWGGDGLFAFPVSAS